MRAAQRPSVGLSAPSTRGRAPGCSPTVRRMTMKKGSAMRSRAAVACKSKYQTVTRSKLEARLHRGWVCEQLVIDCDGLRIIVATFRCATLERTPQRTDTLQVVYWVLARAEPKTIRHAGRSIVGHQTDRYPVTTIDGRPQMADRRPPEHWRIIDSRNWAPSEPRPLLSVSCRHSKPRRARALASTNTQINRSPRPWPLCRTRALLRTTC